MNKEVKEMSAQVREILDKYPNRQKEILCYIFGEDTIREIIGKPTYEELQQKVNQLESTLNEVKEWKEEFGDACTFSIVSNPSLGNWYFALEDILEEGGSNE